MIESFKPRVLSRILRFFLIRLPKQESPRREAPPPFNKGGFKLGGKPLKKDTLA